MRRYGESGSERERERRADERKGEDGRIHYSRGDTKREKSRRRKTRWINRKTEK